MVEEFTLGDRVKRFRSGWQGMEAGDEGTVSGFSQDRKWIFLKEFKGIHNIESFINLSAEKRGKNKYKNKKTIMTTPGDEDFVMDGFMPKDKKTSPYNDSGFFKQYDYVNRWYNYNIFIEITELAIRKLRYYVCSTANEISGLGSVKVKKAGKKTIYLVKDIFCLKQESSAGGTKLNAQDVAMFQADWIRKGNNFNSLKCWWHSHGDGQTFWSQTDDKQCDRFGGNNFMVSLVSNHKNEILGRVDKYKPNRVRHVEIKPYIELVDNPKLRKACEEEAKIKNKETTYGWFNKSKGKDKFHKTRGYFRSSQFCEY